MQVDLVPLITEKRRVLDFLITLDAGFQRQKVCLFDYVWEFSGHRGKKTVTLVRSLHLRHSFWHPAALRIELI
jgi:hypothetical protein